MVFEVEDIIISTVFVSFLDGFIFIILDNDLDNNLDRVTDIYELPEPVSRKALYLVPSIETTKTECITLVSSDGNITRIVLLF